MAIINTGKTFVPGETVTATSLNNIADLATFNDPADEVSIELITSGANTGKLGVKDNYVNGFLYPVGSIYINASDSSNPATIFGFGTWEAFGSGRVLLGAGTGTDDQPVPEVISFNAGDTGGEYNHKLTENEMPSHSHAYREAFQQGSGQSSGTDDEPGFRVSNTSSTGSSLTHNNLQPYITVYVWKRTA